MAILRYTVSVNADLVRQFRAVCRERGRTQSFYISACMRRVVGGETEREGPQKKRKRPTKK